MGISYFMKGGKVVGICKDSQHSAKEETSLKISFSFFSSTEDGI
jgi:hypothetical protein